MRVQQGPYIGEVSLDGSYVINKEGEAVEAGAAKTVREAFKIMENRIAELCNQDREAGRKFIPGDLKPFLVR
jgi:hypothetical protein